MKFGDILNQHNDFIAFIGEGGAVVDPHQLPQITLFDLDKFRTDIATWNANPKNAANQIDQVGFFTTLGPESMSESKHLRHFTTNLICLDDAGNIVVEGPGNGGDGPPYYK